MDDHWLTTLLYSWGGDTPPEVVWGLNEMIDLLRVHHPELELIDEEEGISEENLKRLIEALQEKGL